MRNVCEGYFGADAFDNEDFGGGVGGAQSGEYFAEDGHADGDRGADGIAEVGFDENSFGGFGGGWWCINKFCCCSSVYQGRIGCSGVSFYGALQDSYAWIRGRV